MRALIPLFLLTLFAASPANATHVTRVVDFDLDALGNPLSDNDPVDHAYLPWGIIFQAVGPGINCGPSVYARDQFHPAGFGSSPNVVSTCPQPSATDISEEFYKAIQATFSPPATRVCVDIWPISSEHVGILRAFDSGGTLIGSAECAPGVTETVCVGGIGSIHSVQLNGKDTFYAIFDHMEVQFEDGVLDAPVWRPTTTGLQLLAAYPNPAKGPLRLAVSSAAALPVRVDVIDLAGRVVVSEQFTGLGPGLHQFELPAVARLTPGVYFARVVQGREVDRRSFAVLR